MRTSFRLAAALLCSLTAACFVGEDLDSGGSAPSSADAGAAGNGANGGAGSGSTTNGTSLDPDASPSTATGGDPSASAGDSGSITPPGAAGDAGAAPPSSPPPASDGGAGAPTCPAGSAAVTLTVTGASTGFVTSNPPGISVASGSTQTACFSVGQTLVLEESHQLLCDWSGPVSCKDGNLDDKRCEFVVGASPIAVSVAVP